MTISDIAEARRRREERAALIASAADWALHNIPFGLAWRHSAAFHERWPGLDGPTLNAIYTELQRRIVTHFEAPVTEEQLNAAVTGLSGRYSVCMKAADWYEEHRSFAPGAPEFDQRVGEITFAEMILAVVEYLRRQLRAAGQLP